MNGAFSISSSGFLVDNEPRPSLRGFVNDGPTDQIPCKGDKVDCGCGCGECNGAMKAHTRGDAARPKFEFDQFEPEEFKFKKEWTNWPSFLPCPILVLPSVWQSVCGQIVNPDGSVELCTKTCAGTQTGVYKRNAQGKCELDHIARDGLCGDCDCPDGTDGRS